jgi:1,4-dihydroxy-2-naphthoyl-CoA hydrolase
MPAVDDRELVENPPPPGVSSEQAVAFANESIRGTVMEKLGMEFLDIGMARVVARIPVEGNTQPYGILHGGATACMCEGLASFGTAMHAGLDKRVTGIELNINHIRAVSSGHATATGVPLHVGRGTAVWDMKVHDDDGRLVAASRLTLVIRDATP